MLLSALASELRALLIHLGTQDQKLKGSLRGYLASTGFKQALSQPYILRHVPRDCVMLLSPSQGWMLSPWIIWVFLMYTNRAGLYVLWARSPLPSMQFPLDGLAGAERPDMHDLSEMDALNRQSKCVG